jgi:hypothetical protein
MTNESEEKKKSMSTEGNAHGSSAGRATRWSKDTNVTKMMLGVNGEGKGYGREVV